MSARPATKIPKPPLRSVATSQASTSSVKENIPFTTRMLSRRSKSHVDLRSEFKMPTKPVFKKPLASQQNHDVKPAKPPTSRPILRRSMSVSDLKPTSTTKRRPLITPAASTGVKIAPSTRATPRVAAKRPAETKATEAPKPKVLKMKPAPYDYKARFNLLQEKHTELKEKCKSYELRDKETQEELKMFHDIQEQLHECQNRIAILEDDNKSLLIDSKKLKKLQPEFDKYQKANKEMNDELKHYKEYSCMLEQENEDIKNKLEITKLELKDTKTKLSTSLLNTELLDKKNLELTAENEALRSYKEAFLQRDEQCRILHNQVQDLKGNIRVLCRVRPPKESELMDRFETDINYIDESTMEIRKMRGSVSVSGRPTDFKTEFIFDKVFPPNATQADVFEDLAQLVQSALDGYHICVFAYGQTGSGKTYTMQGGYEKEQMGMIPRSIELLFKKIQDLSTVGWTYSVSCSFLEIYNENIKDLLNPNSKQQHEIRFNEGKGTTVTNLTIKEVKSMKELMMLMNEAMQNRKTAATDFNEHSSRSHFVAKVSVEGMNSESQAIFIGSLNLVDLAGSESAKTDNKDRITETKNINKSLSTLGSVMLSLHKKEDHVPYRNSKLTYLLQPCLGGNSKTLMFVNISPFEDCYNESLSSLRFAAKVKEVKLGSKRNKMYTK